MRFAELYKTNQASVKRMLETLWCANAQGNIQEQYSEQLRELIDKELFTPQNAMPLVQCMDRYESVDSGTERLAESLVTTNDGENLWLKSIKNKDNKYYPPYKHQYKAWKALLEDNNSMVVTTGTGSGKTECFMLPLVKDLNDNHRLGKIQAIFLYPLNALMEDQKERLQKLLAGSNLKFAVYNGNLPNDWPEDMDSPEAKKIVEERNKYPNIVPTRKELRSLATTPNILLTNPTMLELMLLRNKDQNLFSQGSLRWIVIDETHTFTGAGATELAMLIRRVLDAFGQDASSVRFATSSATIGNGGDGELKKFIADITGADINQIDAIDGTRISKEFDPTDSEKEICRNKLKQNDYIRLDKLVDGDSVEDRLERLDKMCDGDAPLKAKVHYFYRVPNNGLKVNLNDHNDGVWNIKSYTPVEKGATPYLELYRCEHCGEYFAVGETVPGSSKKFQALSKSSSDMFDFDSDNDDKSRIIFALSDHDVDRMAKDGDNEWQINGDEYEPYAISPTGWRVVANVKGKCPHCHKSLFGKENNDVDSEEITELEKHASSFRVQAQFVSRVLAPSILDQMREYEEKAGDDRKKEDLPHNGQQFISFVDSRQAAARSTMQQNIEEERLWVYSRLYRELTERAENNGGQKEAEEIERQIAEAASKKQWGEVARLSAMLEKNQKNSTSPLVSYMSWTDIHQFLDEQKESDLLCYQFVDKGEGSREIDADTGKILPDAKNRYLQTVMMEQLGKRPRTSASPETMGLFTSYYPKIDRLNELPDAVKDFNKKFLQGRPEIDLQEWKNLLKIFMDTTVRSNQSIYLKDDCFLPNLDIMACQRFETKKQPRRSVHEPTVGDAKQSKYSNVVLLLANLITPDADYSVLRETAFRNKTDINCILKALWENLTINIGLIQQGSLLKDGRWQSDKNEDGTPIFRLNVFDIAFKLYDKAWLCDSRSIGEMMPALRPVDTLFMGYSPYVVNGKPAKPVEQIENLDDWRPLEFAERIHRIKAYPQIFVQAEHTAQVEKSTSKQSQDMFKNQEINILACSTTMEMGVDLGNLELVMMSSIPPHPANYKQRAGRSGRNDDTRSACITLCGSDAIGIKTLENPLDELILRPMAVPFVDLQSVQVVQRHVNAFLLRLSGLLNDEDDSNNLGMKVCDFFTPYSLFEHDKGGFFELKDRNGQLVYPTGLLKKNDTDKTLFDNFLDFLTDGETNPKRQDGNNRLDLIVRKTCLEGDVHNIVKRCKSDISRCKDELQEVVEDINEAYLQEMETSKKKNKVTGDCVDTKYGYLLRHKYIDALAKNLLQFFATSRFTPNANMPVNVIEFAKNMRSGKTKDYHFRKSNNPSYPLHEAIAQYAPGNTIVLENRTYVVRGLQYTGMYRKTYTFKTLFSNGNVTKIAIDGSNMHPAPVSWPINDKEALTLIEPATCIPDINEKVSRVVERSPYTQVSAQLIGVEEDWTDYASPNSLISMRNNEECKNAQILYYNEGCGYGYQFCTKCGKTVMETYFGKPAYKGLEEMHDQSKQNPDGSTQSFHYMINRLNDNNTKKPCPSGKVLRNVIIGGLIQTDYCEIKIRKSSLSTWQMPRKENIKLLTTLGIVIANVFADFIGKERRDIDFVVMPNSHLCIFDTNPGGSGYSNQLSNKLTMQEVLTRSLTVLDKVKTKDGLLDKWTVRYLDMIDCAAAKDWLRQAVEAMTCVPEEIKKSFTSDVQQSSMSEIVKAIQTSAPIARKWLFVNSDYSNWFYNDDTAEKRLGWKQRIQEIRITSTGLQLNILGNDYINPPCQSILSSISDWATVCKSDNPLCSGLMPIAYIGDTIYFTSNALCASLDNNWARDCVFCTKVSDVHIKIQPLDLTVSHNNTKKFIIGNNAPNKIYSTQLFDVVNKEIHDLTERFWDYCKTQDGEIKVTYQDEHLKSITAMVTTLQFIEKIMLPINKKFSLDFLTEEYEERDNYRNISSNIYNWIDRNETFRNLLEEWRENVSYCNNTDNIKTYRGKSLPHWRELKIECGGKALSIYPNGGFINEWFLDENKMYLDHNVLTDDNVSVDSKIPLFRRKDIMYDAEIKDVM